MLDYIRGVRNAAKAAGISKSLLERWVADGRVVPSGEEAGTGPQKKAYLFTSEDINKIKMLRAFRGRMPRPWARIQALKEVL